MVVVVVVVAVVVVVVARGLTKFAKQNFKNCKSSSICLRVQDIFSENVKNAKHVKLCVVLAKC